MTIEGILKEVAEKFNGYSYVFDDWQTVDAKLEKAELPAIVSILATSGRVDLGIDGVTRSKFVAVAFMDKVPRDADGEENAEVTNRMEDTAIEFVKKLNESGKIKPIEAFDYTPIYEGMGDIISGVMISLNIELNAYPSC